MNRYTLLIVVIGLITISCNQTKNVIENEFEDNDRITSYTVASDYPLEIKDPKTTQKVLSIVLNYTNEPLSSIALSRIFLTEELQYSWKFLNVKTGESYVAKANGIFEDIIISKRKVN